MLNWRLQLLLGLLLLLLFRHWPTLVDPSSRHRRDPQPPLVPVGGAEPGRFSHQRQSVLHPWWLLQGRASTSCRCWNRHLLPCHHALHPYRGQGRASSFRHYFADHSDGTWVGCLGRYYYRYYRKRQYAAC
uniref:Putative secreted protein n=1 Tax=Anopheles marajoara TaxID=58244 RepID=A0A2M4C6X2_9DIPT